MKRKKIIAIHLLNDFSGSPFVLKQSLEVLKTDFDIHLFTATPSGKGILSDMDGISKHNIDYAWHPNKLITLLLFSWSQLILFFKVFFLLSPGDSVYINTLLPFSASIAAKLKGNRVIYHIHEVSIKPRVFKSFLAWIAGSCASKIIFVSEYVKTQYQFKGDKVEVIYNALPDQFVKRAMDFNGKNSVAPFTALMICSFKRYKGIYEFIEIAKKLPNIQFNLVLNTSERDTLAFLKEVIPPNNCQVFPAQQNTAFFYENAHLLLNLSDPAEWIETFGMTILEGMYYGLPAIVPPVGGVTELINDAYEGYLIPSSSINNIVNVIEHLSYDQAHYLVLAKAAKNKAQYFSQSSFKMGIQGVFSFNSSINQIHALEF